MHDSRVSRFAGEKRCEKASVDEAFIDITALAEELLDTGRLPSQFAPSDKSQPQRWCAAGWLRRQPHCPCENCSGGVRRAALAAEGYSQLFEAPLEEAALGRPAPDGSIFFRPPTPAQRWSLRHPLPAPAEAPGFTEAASAAAETASAAPRTNSADAPAVPPLLEEPGAGEAAAEAVSAPASATATKAWAVASQHPVPAAADCVFAVLEFAAAGRWHVLDDSGRNTDAAAAKLPPDLASPLSSRLCAGAVVAECIRRIVYEELQLTCSTGVAHNKMLAKLASARNKPDKQTLVLSQTVPGIMRSLSLQKIRGLGGKLGAALCAAARAVSEAAAATAASAVDVATRSAAADSGGHVSGGSDASDSEDEGDQALGAGGAVAPAAGDAPVTAGMAQQLSFSALCSIAGGEERASSVYRLLRGGY